MVDTQVKVGSLTLKNPVLVASGTFGYGDECRELVDVNLFGGIVTKSLSMKPREGNPPVRLAETASGMLNSIGLANIGVDRFIEEKLPYLRTLDTSVIVNIAGSTIDEYCEVLSTLEDCEGVDAYEINVSCPNVKEGGLSFGTNRQTVAEITRRLRKRTQRPLVIKLTPNVTHISEFAQAAADAGADAVSLINAVVGMAVDIETKKPKLSTTVGGLSGPAIKPIALAKVLEVARTVDIPIIGIGGIMSPSDAIEFLLVGATAIQVGTANFVDPSIAVKIIEGIKDYCGRKKLESVSDLVGALELEKDVFTINE